MKIVVLAGGLSPERDVSLSSGSLIANILRESGHRVLLLDAFKGIEADKDKFDELFKDNITGKPYSYKIPDEEPDLEELKKSGKNGDSILGKNVLSLCQFADVVFMGLHGAMGENGQIQAAFDLLGIKYTGTGYIGSLLAMDKDLTKKMLQQAGVRVPKGATFSYDSISLKKVNEEIELPCVIKPTSGGSSIGVSMVDNAGEFENAATLAKKYEANILVEEKIEGREFSVGILEGKALPVIEIIPLKGFYDYKNKYQAGLTKEICPAELSESDTKKVQSIALKVHRVLRLGTYSRVDFIRDKNGEFVCLEANTLPGMTPTSLIPQEALACNISYKELCNLIVNSALR